MPRVGRFDRDFPRRYLVHRDLQPVAFEQVVQCAGDFERRRTQPFSKGLDWWSLPTCQNIFSPAQVHIAFGFQAKVLRHRRKGASLTPFLTVPHVLHESHICPLPRVSVSCSMVMSQCDFCRRNGLLNISSKSRHRGRFRVKIGTIEGDTREFKRGSLHRAMCAALCFLGRRLQDWDFSACWSPGMSDSDLSFKVVDGICQPYGAEVRRHPGDREPCPHARSPPRLSVGKNPN